VADVATGKLVVAPTRTVIKNLDHGQVREIMTKKDTAGMVTVDVIEGSADETTVAADILVDIVIHHE